MSTSCLFDLILVQPDQFRRLRDVQIQNEQLCQAHVSLPPVPLSSRQQNCVDLCFPSLPCRVACSGCWTFFCMHHLLFVITVTASGSSVVFVMLYLPFWSLRILIGYSVSSGFSLRIVVFFSFLFLNTLLYLCSFFFFFVFFFYEKYG